MTTFFSFQMLTLLAIGTLSSLTRASDAVSVSLADVPSSADEQINSDFLFKTGVSATSDLNAALFKTFCDSVPYQSAYTLCSTVSPSSYPVSQSPESGKFCIDSVSTASSGTLTYIADAKPTGKYCAYAISAPGKSILFTCTTVAFVGNASPVRYTEMANGVNKLVVPNGQLVAQNSILIFAAKNTDLKQLNCSWKSA